MSELEIEQYDLARNKLHNINPRLDNILIATLWSAGINYDMEVSDFADMVEEAAKAIMCEEGKEFEDSFNIGYFFTLLLTKLNRQRFVKVKSCHSLAAIKNTTSLTMVEEGLTIQESNNAEEIIVEHKLRQKEMGAILQSTHESLHFQFNQKSNKSVEVIKIIADAQSLDRKYIETEDYFNSLKKTFEDMESRLNQHLKKRGLDYMKIEDDTKDFKNPTIIIAKLILDEEEEEDFVPKKVKAELFTVKGNIVKCYLNFKAYSDNFYLHPNTYVAIKVQGTISDKKASLKVSEIYELYSELDETDAEEPPQKEISDYMNIMIFKGPFNLNNEISFSKLDMIKHHIEKDRSINSVVLIGPFVQTKQTSYSGKQPKLRSMASMRQYRDENIKRFFKEATEINPDLTVIIVPDTNDPNDLSYYPVPKLSIEGQSANLITVSSPCLLRFKSKNTSHTISISSLNLLSYVMRSSPQNKDSKKFIQPLRPLISASNLIPALLPYPLIDDYSINELAYSENDKPEVIIMTSSIDAFTVKARGTLVCNPKSIFDEDKFGTCARVYFDSNTKGVNGARVDILQF